MSINFKDVGPMGGMKPWACSYTKGDTWYAITLYGTDPDQIVRDHSYELPNLKVDGELVSEGWRD